MTHIVLVRHGETESNRLGVFRGRLDVPLNDVGRAQAEGLAAALAGDPMAAVYSSPLARAWDTARALASGTDSLRWQTRRSTTSTSAPGRARTRRASSATSPTSGASGSPIPRGWPFPGGETLAGVRERSHRRALELVREHEGRRFAIVTHRSVLKLLGGALLGIDDPFWKLYLDNAGYCVIAHEGGRFVLEKWNESCHVKDRVIERY